MVKVDTSEFVSRNFVPAFRAGRGQRSANFMEVELGVPGHLPPHDL
jgi:hypothetical protein